MSVLAPPPAAPTEAAPRRHRAAALHALCADRLPGYLAAVREPWRQALLTAGCLDPHPLPLPRRAAPPVVIAGVEQPSDVLCALWLARRSGLFHPGSSCGDAAGLRSGCDIVPEFAPRVRAARRAEVWETLRANAAWRAHAAARTAVAA